MDDRRRILIKTTIPAIPDDWHVGRFSRMAAVLSEAEDADGRRLYAVTARDREADASGDDADLAALAEGAYDELWLIATDVTGALTPRDVGHIAAFRARGGGLLLTRDHQDLGACLAGLGAVGATQHFQTVNPEPEPERRQCDDLDTPAITWPNYHSGANGDLQRIEAASPLHPLMRRPDGSAIERLPAHPHEGVVGAPPSLAGAARVVASGMSLVSGSRFNLCVAVEEAGQGRAVSDSSFHHFADYNWDPRLGCPSFVSEPAGEAVVRDPGALDDVACYVRNIAAWLAADG